LSDSVALIIGVCGADAVRRIHSLNELKTEAQEDSLPDEGFAQLSEC
jgi:hypothetical protein